LVADNIWDIRLGFGSLLLGAASGALVGFYLARSEERNEGTNSLEGWPVNLAHRWGAGIATENTIAAFREALRVGGEGLELDVHLTADGHLVVIHDDGVDRTTDGTGLVREMTLREIKDLDAGYRFSHDGTETYPYRGQGVTVPTLEEVYREFPDVPINLEIKEARPDIEKAVWRAIEEAGAEERTLVVSQMTAVIRRFRRASSGRVATASSIGEIIAFDLLSRLGLSKLLRPSYQALQGPEVYRGLLRIVTSGFVRAAHEQGTRVDVWTIDSAADMRRLLSYGVDGIMTDRPDVLAKLLRG